MNLFVFSVYDSKVEAFMNPFFMNSKGEAIRAFSDTVADSKHPFAKHPADYTLFCLGTFDNSTGEFDRLSTPQSLGLAIEFIANC